MPDIVINNDGSITTVYSDDLHSLYDEGSVSIKRASHVEPGDNGKWYADLSPVSGPVLGPFTLRQEALDEEVKWLRNNL